ncbi:MAG: prepilin-type N-terminal cleavage/methylation domain-containing protein, partial [Planctomycetota bacterium]|nr:prepilin-type N-terminal cleavage/methylation domain-containing protein [Planctomycetota bacterium]
MKRSTKKGFTLVEILIVVIILGILAAIVIPQFTQASTQAKESNLKTNLQTIRSQLLLYKMQHDAEAYPGAAFVAQMTTYTNSAGAAQAASDATHNLGPYLQSIPVNPASNLNAVRIVNGAGTAFAAPTTDGGWWFNSTTGEFRADLKATWVQADGTLYNAL